MEPTDVDVAESERAELLRDLHTAMQQIDAGQGVSHRDAKAELRQRFEPE